MAAFDPLAGSQINVDPSLGDSRYEALVRQLIARGMSPEEARKQARAMLESPDIVGQRPIAVEEAELNAAQDAAQPQINSYRAGYTQPAPGTAAWKAQERSMGLETLPFQQADEQAVRDEFYRRFGREPSSYREIEMMREMMAEQSAGQLRNDLAQGGYGQRRAPGQRTVDGRPTAQGAPFRSVDEAAAYYARPAGGTPGGFGQSEYDRDMEQRGLVPRYDDNGQLGFSVIAGDDRAAINVPYGVPGAPGRVGARPGLEAAGWSAETVDTPSGQRRVYVPEQNYVFVNGKYVPKAPSGQNITAVDQPAQGPQSPSRYGAKDRANDYQAERRLYRMAAAAGMTPAEMRAADPAMFGDTATGVGSLRPGAAARQAVAAKRAAGESDRMQRFLAQVQLGGGRQTPQSIQLETMLNGMTDEQRQQAMRYMVPGGQLAAMVDAQNAASAAKMAQSAVTSFLANNQGAGDLLRDKQKQENVANAQKWWDAKFENDHGTVDGGFWGRPYYNDQYEQDVRYMMNVYGLDRPAAEAIASSRGTPRHAGPAPSTPPAAPGAGGPRMPPGAPVGR